MTSKPRRDIGSRLPACVYRRHMKPEWAVAVNKRASTSLIDEAASSLHPQRLANLTRDLLGPRDDRRSHPGSHPVYRLRQQMAPDLSSYGIRCRTSYDVESTHP